MAFSIGLRGFVLLLTAQIVFAADIQRAEVLHTFRGNDADGSNPMTGLLWGSDGALYGTTSGSAELNEGALKYGTIFRLTLDGQFSTLFAFSKTNGWKPNELILADDGNLYGTTAAGGSDEMLGAGTVFRLTLGGQLTTLFEFQFGSSNGATPAAGLVQGSDGAFYGTTALTRFTENPSVSAESGTVFRITKSGEFTNLFQFSEQSHSISGGLPMAGLIEGTPGLFYGTTMRGGTNGHGTIFSIATNGTHTVLHHFRRTDGAAPVATLVMGSNGFLYGTTLYGNASVFRIRPNGEAFEILSNFGWLTPLIQSHDGNFYGTTEALFYRMSPDGEVKVQGKLVYAYTGNQTFAPLLEGPDGSLYGTGLQGSLFGTVYKLTFEPLTLALQQEDGQAVITWLKSSLDRTGEFDYHAQYTTNLREPRTWNYVDLASVFVEQAVEGKLPRFICREPRGGAQRFYRLIRR